MSSKNLIAKIVVVAIATGFCFWGCKKNDASTQPVLTLKSINSYEIKKGSVLSITLTCSNVSVLKTLAADTALGAKFLVINAASCTSSSGSKNRVFTYDLPTTNGFTGTSDVVINWVNGSNGVGLPSGYGVLPTTNCRPIDSTNIKFWVRTTGGVTSDTVITDHPIAIYNQ